MDIPDTTDNMSEEKQTPTFEVEAAEQQYKDIGGMYSDLANEFGEEAIKQMVEAELSQQAADVIDFLFSNREQIGRE